MCQSAIAVTFIAIFIWCSHAYSEEAPTHRLAIDTYLCEQFISDAAHPDDAQKLVRALMMISWAAGFAAAHEKAGPRADKSKLQLVSATLKRICQTKPHETATRAFIYEVTRYLAQQ